MVEQFVSRKAGKNHQYLAVIIGDRELPVLDGSGQIDVWSFKGKHESVDRALKALEGSDLKVVS